MLEMSVRASQKHLQAQAQALRTTTSKRINIKSDKIAHLALFQQVGWLNPALRGVQGGSTVPNPSLSIALQG